MSSSPKTNGVTIITTDAERKQFLEFPYQHYEDDELWVPPLRMEQKKLIDTQKNPFYNNADISLFLAEQNGSVCGRIAAIEDRRYNAHHNTNVGFFGFFECINDPSVARLLFRVVKDWMRERGLSSILGPASPSMMDEVGILVDGFEHRPSFMMPYHKPYYDELLTSAGLKKEMDLYAFRVTKESVSLARMERAEELVLKRNPNLRVRSVNLKDLKNEVQIVRHIFNKAWSQNWGFIPLTEEELASLAKDLRFVLDPEVAHIAEINGEPVGFSIALPDLNQALQHMDGSLFPTGVFKFLWHRRNIDSIRTALMGVLPEHQGKGIDALLNKYAITKGLAKGYTSSELSWVLETNSTMQRVAERVGGYIEKTYRMYSAEL